MPQQAEAHPRKVQERTSHLLGPGITGGCELPGLGCWELNLGPLKRHLQPGQCKVNAECFHTSSYTYSQQDLPGSCCVNLFTPSLSQLKPSTILQPPTSVTQSSEEAGEPHYTHDLVSSGSDFLKRIWTCLYRFPVP